MSKDFLDALEHYLEAKSEHDQARAKYHGHSWGYYGGPWVDAMHQAQKDFESALNKHITDVVEEKLSLILSGRLTRFNSLDNRDSEILVDKIK